MNERLEKWENLGLLAKTPETKKVFVANALELLLSHLNYVYKEEQDGKFETLIFPIFTRIGNEIEFSINDLFSIINEVREGVDNLQYSEYIDIEASFVEKYCENKINELNNR
jgi:hypothetical protein